MRQGLVEHPDRASTAMSTFRTSFKCPLCDGSVIVKTDLERLHGKNAKCPYCQNQFKILKTRNGYAAMGIAKVEPKLL